MADENRGWRQFHRLNLDGKSFSRRVKRAEGVTVRHAHKFIVKRLDNIRHVRNDIISWLLLVGCLIAVVAVQIIWFQRNYQTTVPAEGGTYAEASQGPIDTLNPLYAASEAEIAASRLLFSSLYNYDQTGHLRGDLAEYYEIDPTNKVYTIHLRPGVKWHDGAALTARDIEFTVNLIKKPETRSPLRVNWQDVSIKALNSQTVQFTLPAVYAAFPHALTFPVLPHHILGNVAPGAIRENAFSRSPTGSGPFSLRLLQTVGVNTGRKIAQLDAFSDYHLGRPRLGRFEVHAYDTSSKIVSALRTGEVSAAVGIAPSETQKINSRQYSLTVQNVNNGVYALFNVERPSLKETAVRQALRLSIDTVALRKRLPARVASLDLPFINGQIPVSDMPHAPSVNVRQAEKMLDDAGWKRVGDGRQKEGQTLRLTIVTTKGDMYEQVTDMLVEAWQKIGVQVNKNIVDTTKPGANFVQNILQPRAYDVLVYELFIGSDPDVYAYWHSSQLGMNGFNFTNYANPIADAALASARDRVEPELRAAKYKVFARQWLDDVPAIGLYQSVSVYAANRATYNVDPSATLITGSDRFSNILYWSARQEPVYKTP